MKDCNNSGSTLDQTGVKLKQKLLYRFVDHNAIGSNRFDLLIVITRLVRVIHAILRGLGLWSWIARTSRAMTLRESGVIKTPLKLLRQFPFPWPPAFRARYNLLEPGVCGRVRNSSLPGQMAGACLLSTSAADKWRLRTRAWPEIRLHLHRGRGRHGCGRNSWSER